MVNDLSRIYRGVVRLARASGSTEEANAINARYTALWQAWDHQLPNNAFVRRQLGLSH